MLIDPLKIGYQSNWIVHSISAVSTLNSSAILTTPSVHHPLLHSPLIVWLPPPGNTCHPSPNLINVSHNIYPKLDVP